MNVVLMRMLNRRYTRSSIKEARRSAVSALYAEKICLDLRAVVVMTILSLKTCTYLFL